MAKATEIGETVFLELELKEAKYLRRLIGWHVVGDGRNRLLNTDIWEALEKVHSLNGLGSLKTQGKFHCVHLVPE